MRLLPQELHNSFRPSEDGRLFIAHSADALRLSPLHTLATIVLERLVNGTELGGEKGFDEPLLRSIRDREPAGLDDIRLTLWQGQQVANTAKDLLFANSMGEVQPPVSADEDTELMKIVAVVESHMHCRADAKYMAMAARP